jgi:hypothetical protein
MNSFFSVFLFCFVLLFFLLRYITFCDAMRWLMDDLCGFRVHGLSLSPSLSLSFFLSFSYRCWQVTALKSENAISWGLVVPSESYSGAVMGDASHSIGMSQDQSDGKTKFNGTGLTSVDLVGVPRFAVGTLIGFRLTFGGNVFQMDFHVNDRVVHTARDLPWDAAYRVACTLGTDAKLKLLPVDGMCEARRTVTYT